MPRIATLAAGRRTPRCGSGAGGSTRSSETAAAATATSSAVWFFAGSRFVGFDAPAPSLEILALWRDDRTMAFLYVLYRPSDALCCPTGGGRVVRFRWNGRHVVRLDPLPPRRLGHGLSR